MKYLRFLAGFIVFILFLGGCMKRPSYSANELFTNKFYFEIDGEPVIPVDREIPVRFQYAGSILKILVNDYDLNLVVRVKDFHGPGTYTFGDFSDSTLTGNNFIFYNACCYSTFYSRSDKPAYLRILDFDTTAHHQLITGIFDFHLANDSLEVHLSNGYFFWTVIGTDN